MVSCLLAVAQFLQVIFTYPERKAATSITTGQENSSFNRNCNIAKINLIETDYSYLNAIIYFIIANDHNTIRKFLSLPASN